MADFTIELKEVVELVYGNVLEPFSWQQNYKDLNYEGIKYKHMPVVDDWSSIGLGYYPIFDEAYRDVLNSKILTEFYNREICVETIDMWVQRVQSKMNIIMPYYNKLYLTEKIPYKALDSIKIDTTRADKVSGTEENTSSHTTTSDTNSSSRAVNSDTPQTMLAGDEDYANGATDANSQTTANSNADGTTNSVNNSEVDGNSSTTGYQGAASDLVTKYRNSLLNIDSMVINDIQELFMGILNTGDTMFNTNGYWH